MCVVSLERIDLKSAHSEKNVGNQSAERCWLHILYQKYRTSYTGNERSELGLLLMCLFLWRKYGLFEIKSILIGL